MKAMFLHGLGQDSSVWKQVLDNIDNHTGVALCPDLSTWLMNKQTIYLCIKNWKDNVQSFPNRWTYVEYPWAVF